MKSGTDSALVSILVPAYSPTYLRDALNSAIAQTYPNIEIVVVNDNPGSAIEQVVRECSAQREIRYFTNKQNLGGRQTYARCLELASGTYIKFLNDDDLLAADCVERMIGAFERYGRPVSLVTSKRLAIDSLGNQLPDRPWTVPLFQADSYVVGHGLAELVLRTLTNFIGEPTTVMFRREDLARVKPGIFSLNGREYSWNGDVVVWLNLLLFGDAVYLADNLSYFRQHKGQVQRDPANFISLLTSWETIVEDARAMGLLDDNEAYREARLRLLGIFNRMVTQKKLEIRHQEQLRRRCQEIFITLSEDGKSAAQIGAEIEQLPHVTFRAANLKLKLA